MGRPCKCCEGEDCSATRVFNEKGIYENHAFPIRFESQWDVLRGDPFIASRDGVLQENAATQTLLVGYKQPTGDVIALHKTPMSTSRDVNILKLNVSDQGYSSAQPGSFINLRSRASIHTQIEQQFPVPLPNEIGSIRTFGDYLFFAKENAAGDFASGWAIRISVKCVKRINVRTKITKWTRQIVAAPNIEKYGYEVDYKLLNTDGNQVANCLIYLPAYYDWSPPEGYNGDGAINALSTIGQGGSPGPGVTNVLDIEKKTSGFGAKTSLFNEYGTEISSVDNSKTRDPDTGQMIPYYTDYFGVFADPSDMIGGLLNNIYIESRCDSPIVQFWASQPSDVSLSLGDAGNNSIRPSPLVGIADGGNTGNSTLENGFEFLLFNQNIRDFDRPGNRWGFRQAQGVTYETVEENPEVEQDGKPNLFRRSPLGRPYNAYPSFDFKNGLMTQGAVIGTGKDSILTGDQGFSGPFGKEYSNLCDPCFKSMMFNSGTSGIPTPIFKIVIEGFPETGSYSHGGASDILSASYGPSVEYEYNITSSINGTYYVTNGASLGRIGCSDGELLDGGQGTSICGLPNTLLAIDCGDYKIFDTEINDGKITRAGELTSIGGRYRHGKITLDFFTPHVFFTGVEGLMDGLETYSRGWRLSPPVTRVDTYLHKNWYVEMAGLGGPSYFGGPKTRYYKANIKGGAGGPKYDSPICRNASPSTNLGINNILRRRNGFPIRAIFSNSTPSSNDILKYDTYDQNQFHYLDFVFEKVDFGGGQFRPCLHRRSRVKSGNYWNGTSWVPRVPENWSPIDRATVKIFMVSEVGE